MLLFYYIYTVFAEISRLGELNYSNDTIQVMLHMS